MWNEKRSGSSVDHQGTVKTTKLNGNRCHLTAGELEFLNAEKVSARAVEVKMPMSQAQLLISAANRLVGSFHPSDQIPGYAGYVPVSSNRVVDLNTVSGIMDLGGFSVSESPEHGSPALD